MQVSDLINTEKQENLEKIFFEGGGQQTGDNSPGEKSHYEPQAFGQSTNQINIDDYSQMRLKAMRKMNDE